MANIFQFNDYRVYLRGALQAAHDGKASARAALARHLGVHSSLVGKILQGEKQLTPDQAFQTGQFLNLSQLEAEYFLQLVHHARAGNAKYRESLRQRLDELRKLAGQDGEDVPALRPEHQFTYYSQWYYSAISLLTALPSFNGPDFVRRSAQKLRLPESVVREVLEFLVEVGICTREGDRWGLRKRTLQLMGDTGLVNRHLANWRIKGLERIQEPVGAAYFQVHPVALSRRAGEEAKGILKDALRRIDELTGKEPAEVLYCLNLDWFDL